MSELGDWRPSINRLHYSSLDREELRSLEEAFSKDGVLSDLSSLCGDKAPSLDGFTMAFWQFCWDIVKNEVMAFFMEFHDTGHFERSLNVTFIVFIPKKQGVEDLKDFCPISLVGGVYNLLVKVFAYRLTRMVRKMISNFQHAFVEGK